jgi:hypothetical protein
LTHLFSGIAHAIFAAFVSGRWSDAYALFPLLQERLLTQSEYSPMATHCEKGYYSILQIALARSSRATIDATVAALSRFYPDATTVPRLLLRDKTHLEKARPVLERLGDRRFLCCLQGVEAALASHAAA